jgi:hypothetical protein
VTLFPVGNGLTTGSAASAAPAERMEKMSASLSNVARV